jgi:nitrate reductase assembly molybdenum cofactor insertion protein NarJ
MTSVIGGRVGPRYRRTMAATDALQQIAAVMVRPDDGYLDRVDALRDALANRQGEAARQLGVFATRLAGLSVEELQEVFDETFDRDRASGLAHLAAQFAEGRGEAAALDSLVFIEHLLPALEADRNPFVYLCKAVCCLVLACPLRHAPASLPTERVSS